MSEITDRIRRVKGYSVVEVVELFHPLRQKGPKFLGLCPFCGHAGRMFDVDPRRKRWKCWGCLRHGDGLDFVQRHLDLGFVEALEYLERRLGIR